MVESSTKLVIILIDHSATTTIVTQTSLSTSSTDKLNLRLVRASLYLSQFNLRVFHKPGKEHVVPDALSRLKSVAQDFHPIPSNESTLDDIDLYAFYVSLVQMSLDFA